MRKSIQRTALILVILGIVLFAVSYKVMFRSVVSNPEDKFLYVDSDDNYDSLVYKLRTDSFYTARSSFHMLAKRMNLTERVIAGKYRIQHGWSMLALVRHLRSGKWEREVIKLRSEMDRDSLLYYLAEHLEPSADEIEAALFGSWLREEGFTKENVWCIFLPDHYFFNWSCSAEGIVERFYKEYQKYWSEGRLAMAYKKDLSPEEVCILATISDGEAIHTDELERISGLYLNRLRIGMPLQADPTSMFVNGKLQRRLATYDDIKRDHAYNTHKYVGLPPGPILFPDKRAIESVLKAEKHNFIYMCAIGDGSYRHNFATNIRDHNRNVATYRRNRRSN